MTPMFLWNQAAVRYALAGLCAISICHVPHCQVAIVAAEKFDILWAHSNKLDQF